MSYRGFLIRQTPTQWQAVRPLDATWLDGYQGKSALELKSRIDAHHNGF